MAEFNKELLLISAIISVIFALAVITSMLGGLHPLPALLWNGVSALHIDYDLLSFGQAQNPMILAAEVLDAIVFTLLAFTLATLSYEFMRGLKLEERLSYSRVKRLKGHVILTHHNKFSESLCALLAHDNVPYVMLRSSNVEEVHLRRKRILSILADPRTAAAFNLAGIGLAQCVVACSGDDIENALVVLTAKSASKKTRVFSRASSLDILPMLNKAGAERIIMPEVSAGTRMGEEIIRRVFPHGKASD